MTNTQGDLFNQPEEEPAQTGAADKARAELTQEARRNRALERENNARRSEEYASAREERIARAAEQGVDFLRTHAEVKKENDRRGLDAVRQAIDDAPPPSDIKL